MVRVRVALHEERDASYDIVIGRGLLAELPALLARHCPAARYAVITDSHVAPAYGDRLVTQLRDGKVPATLFAFAAGEWNKTRETWAAVSDRMLAAEFGRDSAVVALGGGVAYRIKKDGSNYTQLFAFAGGPESGGLTTTLIYVSNGNFYGTGQYGGGFNWGAIFQMTTPQ